MNKPELLAPCKNFAVLHSAVENGADAVYFGVEKFNMRMNADNFKIEDLKKIARYCHSHNVKCYLTTNIIIYENEIKEIEGLIKKAKTAGIDAVIVHDLAVIEIAKKVGIPFHISTQANVSNSVSLNFYKKLSADRVILARECSLKQIKEIIKKSKIGIEIFIHGAMCVSVSGRCFFSQNFYRKSANRGECMQSCRQKWNVKNENGEMIYDGKMFLNAKDLCMIEHINKLMKMGAVSFKIEGRMKDADYVSTVVRVYREAIDNFDRKKIPIWKKELESVFNRGFCTGFYFERPDNEVDLEKSGNMSSLKKSSLGTVKKYYPKISTAEIQLFHSGIKRGDLIVIEGKNTFLKQTAESIEINHKKIKKAGKGKLIALKVNGRVREGDNVYIMKKIL